MLIGIFDPMGAQSDCLQCEVCRNLILSSMNTGFLRYAVATVLTVYGIETSRIRNGCKVSINKLQQCLPFTVLKPRFRDFAVNEGYWLQQCLPFTVLKPLYFSGLSEALMKLQQCLPFTVLKLLARLDACHFLMLQQCLPFTVLKLVPFYFRRTRSSRLQQCLPFTVLKL